MSHVKTAISLQESLFQQAEALARQLHISRSQLFAMAVEEFIRQHENQQLLAQINRAYGDGLDQTEQDVLAQARHKHRRRMEGEW